MTPLDDQVTQLEAAIASLDAQRALLGDAAVELAVAALRQQLAGLRSVREMPGPKAPAPAPAPPSLEGEYKQVTVMFADLSGFTALAERLGAEQVRSLMNACFEQLVPIIQKYDGTVDKFLGDAVVALFGAPVAHENDPERALRVALEMMEALAVFNQARGTDLGLHFGINTGVVVAGGLGSEGRQEYSVMGDPVNIASRLEDLSQRAEILVGPDTYRLTAPLFDYEALAPIQVKGKTEPVSPYRLRGLKPRPGAQRGIQGLRSPLVGRASELRRLRGLLRDLTSGRGARAAIIGEAGQGKSRLVAEARRALSSRRGAGSTSRLPVWVEGRALSYTENMSYWVARNLLLGLLELNADTAPEVVAQTLHASVERLFPEQVTDVYPYLARLLELPLDPMTAKWVQYMSPEALQHQILRTFADYVRARAGEQPLVLACEDLHWADPSSLHLLETLLPLTEEAPLLLLFVFRPEEGRIRTFHDRVLSTYGARYQVVELAPLNRDDSTRLLHNLLQIENLPEATRQVILDKAEGNAFFLEELLRSLIDAGIVILQGDRAVATRDVEAIDVPDTLQGVIAARIDRLSPEHKRTLQTAAVIGRVFQQRVLAYLMKAEPASHPLDTSLTELRRRELIRLRALAGPPGTTLPLDQEYIFKHVITQDVTYNSLLIVRRKELHRITGEALEALFPDHLEELSPTLGYHFERAEVHDKAGRCLAKAADRAAATYANEEAIVLYGSAIRQVTQLHDSRATAPEWAEMVAQLQERLGDALELTARHEAAREAYHAAIAQVLACGDDEVTEPGAGAHQPDRTDAERIRHSRLHRKIAETWHGQREFEAALEACLAAESALGLAAAEAAPERCQEWIQIQLDRLRTHYWENRVPEMTALIDRTRPFVEAHASPVQRAQFFGRIWMMACRRDRYVISEEIMGYAKASLEASQESGDLVQIATARFTVGMGHLCRDELDQAEAQILAALTVAERIGDITFQSQCLAYLTMVYRKRRQVEETRRFLEQCLTAATAARRLDYISLARAFRAWVAWRDRDLSEVLVDGRAALEGWQQLPTPYMFQWIVLWPLIDAAIAHDQVDEAIEYARALLDPSQQCLPDAIVATLESAMEASIQDQQEAARSYLQQAVALAEENGQL